MTKFFNVISIVLLFSIILLSVFMEEYAIVGVLALAIVWVVGGTKIWQNQ